MSTVDRKYRQGWVPEPSLNFRRITQSWNQDIVLFMIEISLLDPNTCGVWEAG